MVKNINENLRAMYKPEVEKFLKEKYFECDTGKHNHNSLINRIINYCPNCKRRLYYKLNELNEEKRAALIEAEKQKDWENGYKKVEEIVLYRNFFYKG